MHLGLGSLIPQPPRQLRHEHPLFEWPSRPAGFQGGEYLGVLAPHESELFKNWIVAGYEKPDVALLDLGDRGAALGTGQAVRVPMPACTAPMQVVGSEPRLPGAALSLIES